MHVMRLSLELAAQVYRRMFAEEGVSLLACLRTSSIADYLMERYLGDIRTGSCRMTIISSIIRARMKTELCYVSPFLPQCCFVSCVVEPTSHSASLS